MSERDVQVIRETARGILEGLPEEYRDAGWHAEELIESYIEEKGSRLTIPDAIEFLEQLELVTMDMRLALLILSPRETPGRRTRD